MFHQCKALILHCSDFRLGSWLMKFLEDERLLDDCDDLGWPGAVKDLTDPEEPEDRRTLLKKIKLLIDLHSTRVMILSNHTDCGAYGGSVRFDGGLEKECEFHIQEMRKAKEILRELNPDLKFRMVLAKLISPGKIETEEIEN